MGAGRASGAERVAPVVAQMLWTALVASQCLFSFVLLRLTADMPATLVRADWAWRAGLFGFGLGLTAAIWYLRRRLTRAPDWTLLTGVERARRALGSSLVCWILSALVGASGSVIVFIERRWDAGALFLLWSVALLVLVRPRRTAFGDQGA